MKKNPEKVLELAYDSYQKGDYETALENYEWFFENAIKIDSSWVGAKYRSLKEWYCLAMKYQPAYDALIAKKNILLELFKKNKDDSVLYDYAKICQVLNLNKEFIDLFKKIHNTDKDITKNIYVSIESILIENKEWELCNFYIENSMEKYQTILATFDELIRISKSGFNGEYNKVYEKKFSQDIQNLLTILKTGKRNDEIEDILTQLRTDVETRGGTLDLT